MGGNEVDAGLWQGGGVFVKVGTAGKARKGTLPMTDPRPVC
jgi:hypothetical protein